MECILRAFLFILMLGPILVDILVLFSIAVTANCFTLAYFILFGWCCEIKICSESQCHGPFIEEALIKPWTLLEKLWDKISNFLEGK